MCSLSRYVIAENDYQATTSRSGFQKLMYQPENTIPSIGYLPPITSPPTDMKVIFAFIDRLLDIIDELKSKHIILDVDQAIHSKIVDTM